MKTKLSLTFLLSFIYCLLSSQVPQGFNYQAIARDGVSGNPVTEMIDVKIAILSDDSPETVIWEEIHEYVYPDDHGLFNIVVGQGDYESGPVLNFSDIDWTKPPLYIRTMIYYGGSWKNMGSAQLWSVPYAMVADSLGGPLKKLEVEGETEDMEESLFEVRNTAGHIVFAVYNEGVRIYVSDGDVKGPKGGFAIGGFGLVKQEDDHQYFFVSGDSIRAYIDSTSVKGVKGGFAIGGFDYTKGKPQDYMKVTRDSVRIYLDANPATKGVKGGFAIGGFDYTKGDQNFFNVSMDTLGKVFPSENRILWYPLKNAFRTGKVLIEKRDSVGENSFASGYESKAIGRYSQALGYQAIARKDYSTAIGYQAVANKPNSFALGQWALAKNEESYAFGRGAIAEGFRSFAFGSEGVDSAGALTGVAYAKGDYSFAIGQGSQALGKGSFTLGLADTARGDFSLAMGYNTTASGILSTAIGYETTASGILSTAMGYGTIASGGHSTTIGAYTTASGMVSTAQGYKTIASGWYSTAIGEETKASQQSSTAMGTHTTASGSGSTAMGGNTTASGSVSTAMGASTKASGPSSTAMGANTKASGQSSIAMGYYTQASGSSSTAMGANTTAYGFSSTAMGYYTKAKSYLSLVIGTYNDTTSASSTEWVSTDPLFIIGNGSFFSSSNAFTVLKNGYTAIGHSSPSQMLDVNGNARFRSVGSGTFAYNLNLTTDGVLTTASSDISLKENICPITGALDRVNRMRGVMFTWKNDSGRTPQMGMIAQEVEPVIPELVFTNPVDGLKGINYSQTAALFVEAIKEQQQQIESQQKKIDQLIMMIEELKNR